MQKYDWLVVGGGFQGIIAASLLGQQHSNIAILERSKGLGGVLRGKQYNGLTLDFGCHLFNNEKSDVTNIMLEILDDRYHPVTVEYAGITEGHKKEEVAVPSFSFWPEKRKQAAFDEILENAKVRENSAQKEYTNLQEWLLEHLGADIGEHISKILPFVNGHDASYLSHDSIFKTQMSCIHLLEDEDLVLPLKKEFSEFDKVIALPSQKDRMRFYRDAEKNFKHRNYYPSQNGMYGFAEAAEKYFQRKDIDLLTGYSIQSIENHPVSGVTVTLNNNEKIHTQKLVWTLDAGLLSTLLFGDNVMKDYYLNVPMSLFYYFIPKDVEPRYTYVHDFSDTTEMYRVSSPGFYGHQSNEKGQSYLCAEVPAKTDSDLWKNPENYIDKIWEEIKATDMVDIEQAEEAHAFSTPVSYPLMRVGYQEVYQDLSAKVESEYKDIINVNINAYSKNDIVGVISNAIEQYGISV